MRGEGEREEREVCWRRDLSHAGEAGAGRESAGGEIGVRPEYVSSAPLSDLGDCVDMGHDLSDFRGDMSGLSRGESLLAVRPVPCGGGRLVNGLCHGLTDGNGLSGVGRGESAGGETCPMRGRASVRRGVGKRTLSRTHGRKRIGRRDGEWSLLTVRPVHAGEGGRGERGVCWR